MSRVVFGWRSRLLVFASAAALSAGAAPAQEAAPDDGRFQVAEAKRDTIVVTGERPRSVVEVSRLNADAMDIPQAIQSVTIETIQDQGFTRLGDSIRTISGVVRKEAYMGVTDSFAIRGFDAATGLFNGFRHDYYGSTLDLIHVDRVEVVKGPSSVSTGFLEPGGVVNVVTKRPTDSRFAEFGVSAGSYGRMRVQGDASTPLSDTVSLRVTGAAEQADSFRDHVDSERVTAGAALDWDIAPSTKLELSGIWFDSRSVPDRGFPVGALEGVIYDLPIKRFLGEPSDYYDLEQTQITAVLTHAFSDAWSVRAGVEHGRTTDYRDNVQVTSLEPDGRTVLRNYTVVPGSYNTAAAFADLRGEFKTSLLDHNLVVGVDWGRQRQFYDFRTQDVFEPLDIFNPVYGGLKGTPISCCRFAGVTESVGLYAQDLISIGDHWKVLVGVRHDEFDYRDNDSVGLFSTQFSQGQTTPRFGIVYQPTKEWSVYGNLARSFNPQQFTQLASGETPDASEGEQKEIGVKYASADRRITGSVALFEITKSNVATTDPDDVNFSILSGEQRSRGAEFDISARLTDQLSLIASYAYIDAEVTKDNDIPVGDGLTNVPKHQASLWARYDLPNAPVGFGLGAYYVGEREASLPNTYIVPSYTRLDAALFWSVSDRIEAALNIQNLTDERYYDSQDNLLYPGAPLSALVSLRFKM